MTPLSARDAWDACAEDYAEHRLLWSPIEDHALAALGARAGEGVLDVGCGPGTLSARVAAIGARVTAIDLSPRMVALAREAAAARGVVVDARVMDAQSLALPSASYDALVSCLTFHLLPDPVAAAREAARVLRPGGRASVTVWGPPIPGSPSAALIAALPGPPAPARGGATLRDAFEAAGFAEVREMASEVELAAPLGTWIASFLDGSPLRLALDAAGGREPIAERIRAALRPFADDAGAVRGRVQLATLSAEAVTPASRASRGTRT